MRLKRFVQLMLDLRLDAMASAYQNISKCPEFSERSTESIVQEIVQAQWDDSQQRRMERELVKSRIPCSNAHIQAVDYKHSRKLNRDYFNRLTDCAWVESQNNVIFTGASHSGKKWLASVLVRQAITFGYSVICYSITDLLDLLMLHRQQPLKGPKSALMKFKERLQKVDVLVLIGLGQSSLTQTQCEDLDLVIRLRQQKGAMMVTSPFNTKHWQQYFGNTPASDAICSNLLNNAHRFEFAHPSKKNLEGKDNE